MNRKKLFSCLLRTKIPSNMLVTCRGQLRTEHTREEHRSLGELTLQAGVTGILQNKVMIRRQRKLSDDPWTRCRLQFWKMRGIGRFVELLR